MTRPSYGIALMLEIMQIETSEYVRGRVDAENKDVVDIYFAVTDQMESVKYQLKYLSLSDVEYRALYDAGNLSDASEIDMIEFIKQIAFRPVQQAFWTYAQTNTLSLTYQDLKEYGFVYKYTLGAATWTEYSKTTDLTLSKTYYKNYINNFIVPNADKQGELPYSITYYQLQYACITQAKETNGCVYLTPEEAEAYCKQNYPWCDETTEETEGGDTA